VKQLYFKLNPECYFIKGRSKSAVFDLLTGKTYGLNEEETKILEICENNKKINEYMEFLEKLEIRDLGTFYNNKAPYIQKLRVGSPASDNEIGKPPSLTRAFLEVTNTCSLNCSFCGINGIQRTKGCIGCNVWNEISEPLKLDRWKEIIMELGYLDCAEVFIKGGDITLNWRRTMEIINFASKIIPKTYLTIHHSLLNKHIIEELENKVDLIVQIDNLENIQPDFINILPISPEGWTNVQGNTDNLIIDYVKVDEKTLEKLPIRNKKDISPINLFQFLNNMKFHPCLGHSITICFDGKVLPCSMMRNYVIGNIKEISLADIFSQKMDEINKFWELNLGKIGKCKNCEFKYVCEDCRALEESLTGNLKEKILCDYNP
jgi:radical SAM protein with 4Fe4S-binding SPASM domain